MGGLAFGSSRHLAGGDSLLVRGDDAVLEAPVAEFRNEIKRFQLPPSRFKSVPEVSSMSAELWDLQAALRQEGRSSNEIARIVGHHTLQRVKLKNFEDALQQAQESSPFQYEVQEGDTLVSIARDFQRSVKAITEANPGHQNLEPGEKVTIPTEIPPGFPKLTMAPGLPGEFADYFEGVVAWRDPQGKDKNAARQAWQRLLARPEAERRYKSVWAAFMLGKACENEDPWRAAGYYRNVRSLAQEGYLDSLGLAAASLGLEARVYLNQTNYERATELYLEQMATGDLSAITSLCFTMRGLFSNEVGGLDSMAKNPYTRQVITAYMISTKALQASYGNWGEENGTSSNRLAKVVDEWLAANRRANVRDAISAESLALAAYQNANWAAAEEWIAVAGRSPVAQWLKAKLLFRSGKIADGGAALLKLSTQFRLQAVGQDQIPAELKDNLRVACDDRDAARAIRGELGVFYVSRGQYPEALGAFLEGGFWLDAAYIAERLMTVDELKGYVDTQLVNESDDNDISPGAMSERLRYLLARRLTRTIRGNEARPYYPAEHLAEFDGLAEALLAGWNEALAPEARAESLFTAARLTRAHGMELLGTELGPDWHVFEGNSTGTLSASARAQKHFRLMPATQDEVARATRHGADPEVRFHYRYQAAFLAWEAAKLMRNESDETATVLCTAGSWLKGRDPQTADLFYKTLVRRCGRTSIGGAADRLRWFPEIEEGEIVDPLPADMADPSKVASDENGMEAFAVEFPMPGKTYSVHEGDTLAGIAEAASAWGVIVTTEQILEANEGLDGQSLVIGREITIPDPR